MNKRVTAFFVLICFVLSSLGFTASAMVIPDKIDGPTTLLKPVDGSVTMVKYTVLDDNGDPIDDSQVTWSASNGLFIMTDGNVILSADTPNGSYTINAEVGGISCSAKTIEIQSGMYNDFSSTNDGYISSSQSIDLPTSVKGVMDDFVLDFNFKAAGWSGNKTVMYMILSRGSDWTLPVYLQGDSSYTTYHLRFNDYTTGSNVQQIYSSDVLYNTWANLKISVDYDSDNGYALYDVFFNGTEIFSDIRHASTTYAGLYVLKLQEAGFSMDDVKIYSGKPLSSTDPENKYIGVNIAGETSFGTPRTSTSIFSQYDIKNVFGTSLKSEAAWSVSPAGQGVSVNSIGLLEVSNSAQAGTYMVTANVNGVNYDKSIEITDVNYTLDIIGSDGFVRDHTFNNEIFTFEAFDNYDVPAKASWSLVNNSSGVDISTTSDGKGILTISSDAADGTYTVKAVADPTENFDTDTATKTFTLSSATYSIDGPDSVEVADGNHYYASYALKSSLNNAVTQGVTWVSDDIYILSNGRAVIYSGSPSTSAISATYNGEIYTKDISISSAAVADVPVYTGDILYTGTNTMSVGDGTNEKLLTATITEGGVPYDKADIIWSLVGVSGDFTGQLSDVYISGSKLYVLGQKSGSITVCAKVQKTNITENITITLVDAFTTLDGSTLTIKGSGNENIQIKHYKPASGNFIDAVFGLSDSYVLSNVTIPAASTETTTILDLSLNGMHKVVIENAAHDTNEYNVLVNDNKLFYQTDIKTLLTDARINDYLDVYSTADMSLIQKCSLLYAGFDSSSKDKVIQLTEKDFNKYYISVLLVDYLNGNLTNLADLNLLLSDLSMDTAWVDALKSDVRRTAISNEMLNSISKLELAKDNFILSAIKTGNRSNTKEVKPYLAICNSTKYDNADETGKNRIADAVAGNTYSTLTELIGAIDSVDLTQGASGTGATTGATQTGTIGGSAAVPKPVTPVAPQSIYNDVSVDYWAYNYIKALSDKGIVNGYDGNNFMPELHVTRAEFVKMLAEGFDILAGSGEPFADVSETDWFYKYVSGAYVAGLVLGDGENFKPNEYITRQDAAVMIHRFAKFYGVSFEIGTNSFADVMDISDYAVESVNALTSASVINGMPDGRFAPLNNTTRAEAVKMIFGALEKGGIK